MRDPSANTVTDSAMDTNLIVPYNSQAITPFIDDDATTLDFTVNYIDLPLSDASTFMARSKSEEPAYRSACGVTFTLPLFPTKLKLKRNKMIGDSKREVTFLDETARTDHPIPTALASQSFNDLKSIQEGKVEVCYKSEFIFLSKIAISCRIRRMILVNERETAEARLRDLYHVQLKCKEKQQLSRKRLEKILLQIVTELLRLYYQGPVSMLIATSP